MPDFLNPIKGFGVTFGTMFKRVVTEQYPEEPKVVAPRFHGRHQLNRHPDGLEKCIGCELCAWACPADAIYVEGADNTEEARFSPGERYGSVYQINYLRCIFCGLCIEACPTRALTMTNEFELADNNRADLIFEKVDLLAPLHARHDAAAARHAAGHGRAGLLRGPGHRRHPAPRPAGEHGAGLVIAAATTVDTLGGTGEVVLFWVLAPIAVLAALGLVFARKAVHGALFLALDMICLAILYIVQGAPFLGIVQVVVYTGAVMMLFLFVLMLVGVDASDSHGRDDPRAAVGRAPRRASVSARWRSRSRCG